MSESEKPEVVRQYYFDKKKGILTKRIIYTVGIPTKSSFLYAWQMDSNKLSNRKVRKPQLKKQLRYFAFFMSVPEINPTQVIKLAVKQSGYVANRTIPKLRIMSNTMVNQNPGQGMRGGNGLIQAFGNLIEIANDIDKLELYNRFLEISPFTKCNETVARILWLHRYYTEFNKLPDKLPSEIFFGEEFYRPKQMS